MHKISLRSLFFRFSSIEEVQQKLNGKGASKDEEILYNKPNTETYEYNKSEIHIIAGICKELCSKDL